MSVSREFQGPPGGEYLPLFPPLCETCGYHHSEGYPHVKPIKLSPRDSIVLAQALIDAPYRCPACGVIGDNWRCSPQAPVLTVEAIREAAECLGRQSIAPQATEQRERQVRQRGMSTAELEALVCMCPDCKRRRPDGYKAGEPMRAREPEIDGAEDVRVGASVALGVALALLIVLAVAFA